MIPSPFLGSKAGGPKKSVPCSFRLGFGRISAGAAGQHGALGLVSASAAGGQGGGT